MNVRTVRCLVSVLAVGTIAACGQHAIAETGGLDNRVEEAVTRVEPKVIAWRRDIHQHPELSNREVRTAGLVAEHLRGLGLEVQTGVAGTGVVGLLRGGKPGPVVLLRADMDALPVTERVDLPFASKVTTMYAGQEVGVMHACGHDTHVAILMGVAEVLAGMRDELPGSVKFVFQPAEEGPPAGERGGAEVMVEEGVLEDPRVDAAFALHIWSRVEEVGKLFYSRGASFSSADNFRIVVTGRQTHGANPWGGIDPIVASAHMITALQTIVSREMKLTDRPAVVTVGKIDGGVRDNIIPERVEMLGTLRAQNEDDRATLQASLRRIVEHTAEALRVEAEVTVPFSASAPVTPQDYELLARMLPVLEAVAGPGMLEEKPTTTTAEDFSFIAQRVPSIYIGLGGRPRDVAEADAPDNHSPNFYIDEDALVVGVRAMLAMTLHYLETAAR